MAVQPTFKHHEILKSLKRIPGVRPVATFSRLASRDVYRRSFVLRKFPRESVGAEIGVHKGDFSEQMLRIVHPTKLHLIDPWKHESAEEYRQAYYGGMAGGGQAEPDKRYNEVCRRFHRQIKFGRVAVHRGYSFDVAGTFPDEPSVART